MALFEGDDWYFEVVQWWGFEDGQETSHTYDPDDPFSSEITESELLDEADTLLGHLVWYDEDGVVYKDQYFQMESDDGWEWEELETEVEDARERYE